MKRNFLLPSNSKAIKLGLRRTLVRSVILCSILLHAFNVQAQLMAPKMVFTHADTLRGSLNENRNWWDVLRYDITVKPDYETKTIEGKCIIGFKTSISGEKKLQLDLQSPLIIDSIIFNYEKINFRKVDSNVYLCSLKSIEPKQYIDKIEGGKGWTIKQQNLTIYYHGKPQEAVRPPWDGGWIWRKDANGNPFISVAVQGLGASAWYPCKDHQSDEPDNGASLTVIVPDSLAAVGNGRLESRIENKQTKTNMYVWQVKNPINNYLIIPYIGKYVNFTDTLMGEKGKLDLSYWVLKEDSAKAAIQFKQAKLMLRAFEYWFGPYPFYEDSYKLVEAPHLGMEHQSATAYGNKFLNGYLGKDLSGTGWGLKWDYIIVHESGHEWFANNITTKDIADMWVHEGFTCYSETLFTEFYYGKEAGTDYNVGSRRNILNNQPIIGTYGVNKEGSEDMYAKGAALLHSIRHSINNDDLFRIILRGLNTAFYHQTVTTQQIENYISEQAKFNYSKVFDQYLRTVQIPILELKIDSITSTVQYKYNNCIAGFNLPLTIYNESKQIQLTPTDIWQTKKVTKEAIDLLNKKLIERLYYIKASIQNTNP
jgi:aminopeptidase N